MITGKRKNKSVTIVGGRMNNGNDAVERGAARKGAMIN